MSPSDRFEPGESVPLSIMRQRRRETLTITVPDEARTGWNVIGGNRLCCLETLVASR